MLIGLLAPMWKSSAKVALTGKVTQLYVGYSCICIILFNEWYFWGFTSLQLANGWRHKSYNRWWFTALYGSSVYKVVLRLPFALHQWNYHVCTVAHNPSRLPCNVNIKLCSLFMIEKEDRCCHENFLEVFLSHKPHGCISQTFLGNFSSFCRYL